MSPTLTGCSVAVTRPAERAAGLARAIEARGGVALRCPALAIEGLEAPAPLPDDARDPDVVVFVSPAAVTFGVHQVLTQQQPPQVGAVGQATMAALAQYGWSAPIQPVGSSDSEGLLAASALAAERIAGRCVVIVRGEGGREKLGSTLSARGAQVFYHEVYRRSLPGAFDGALAASADIVTVTSVECLENWLVLTSGQGDGPLRQRPLVVAGDRVAQAAQRLGYPGPIVTADGPADADMVNGVTQAAALIREMSGPL